MNFETFLFILKKNFNVMVSVSVNKAEVFYNATGIEFELKNNRITTRAGGGMDYVLDLDFEYCTEIVIIDYFISVLKLNNIKFTGLI